MKKLYRTLFKKIENKLCNYEVAFNRISLNSLKNDLSKGEEFILFYFTKENSTKNEMVVQFSRLDIIPELKKKYKKETYVLGVEKGDARYTLAESTLLIDERHEFHKVEEIINYLDKKGYLKRNDWIKDEK